MEIREALGVRASDNLRHAELVLIVEGDDDRIALMALLKHHSKFLEKSFNDGVIAIDTLGGASNLGYKVSSIRDSICLYHVFLDKDRWNCSRTTSKYRNQFLGETINETREKIKNGTYKLKNLN